MIFSFNLFNIYKIKHFFNVITHGGLLARQSAGDLKRSQGQMTQILTASKAYCAVCSLQYGRNGGLKVFFNSYVLLSGKLLKKAYPQVCSCPPGYQGDPYTGCNADPCSQSPCGVNAECSKNGIYCTAPITCNPLPSYDPSSLCTMLTSSLILHHAPCSLRPCFFIMHHAHFVPASSAPPNNLLGNTITFIFLQVKRFDQ